MFSDDSEDETELEDPGVDEIETEKKTKWDD